MPDPVEVRLSWAEMHNAMNIGGMRQIENVFKGRPERYGHKATEGWGTHIEGACGEMAVAKLLGIFWSGNLGDLKANDVGRYQIRTRTQHHYELLLHPPDADEKIWILATGIAPEYWVHGWCYGYEGKRDEWWKEHVPGRPAFFVPQVALHDIRSLLGKGTGH